MRVLTVGNLYPPHHLGGYELVWQTAVGRLRERGHSVRVLTSDFERNGGSGEEDDAVRKLRWYWRDHEWPHFGYRERLELERHNAAVFEGLLDDFAPDLVSWWAMGGLSLSLIERARRRGIPSTAVVCDEWMLYGPDRDAWIAGFRGPLRLAAPVAGAVTGIPARVDLSNAGPALFPSETLRRRASERWPLRKTRVVHQGPDAAFSRAPAHDWNWRLLYVGRIDPRKGIDTAILALAMLPPSATLKVVGGGDEAHLTELRELASESGLADRVEFTERPQAELPAEYAAADVLVFPIRWLEPWGLVPLEAMAVGTPVVATGEGGSGEYLDDGRNCLLFEPGSAEGLAAAVERLAADGGLRERLRGGGFETAASIDEGAFYAAVEEMAAEAAGEAG